MAKRGIKVCWWFPKYGHHYSTCRTLSATQHRSRREAAETVLMQNPGAVVEVWGTGRARPTTYRKRAGQVRRVG